MMDDLSLATHQGRSVFDDAGLDKYTTKDVLQAEQYMIEGFNKTANVGYAHGEGEKWLDGGTKGNKPKAAIRWQRTRKKRPRTRWRIHDWSAASSDRPAREKPRP